MNPTITVLLCYTCEKMKSTMSCAMVLMFYLFYGSIVTGKPTPKDWIVGRSDPLPQARGALLGGWRKCNPGDTMEDDCGTCECGPKNLCK